MDNQLDLVSDKLIITFSNKEFFSEPKVSYNSETSNSILTFVNVEENSKAKINTINLNTFLFNQNQELISTNSFTVEQEYKIGFAYGVLGSYIASTIELMNNNTVFLELIKISTILIYGSILNSVGN